jgi:hypothetical protein
VIIAALIVSKTCAQEKFTPPPEVQKIIDETMGGKNLLVDFDQKKFGLGFDSSTSLSDLKAGDPIPTFYIGGDSVRNLDENSAVSRFTKTPTAWTVPVLVKGKCFCTFEVGKSSSNPKWRVTDFKGGHKGRSDDLQKVLEAWPRSAGYHPELIYLTMRHKFFHVPEQNDGNLTPIYRRKDESLAMSADTSYKILVSSKNSLKYSKTDLPASRVGGRK